MNLQSKVSGKGGLALWLMGIAYITASGLRGICFDKRMDGRRHKDFFFFFFHFFFKQPTYDEGMKGHVPEQQSIQSPWRLYRSFPHIYIYTSSMPYFEQFNNILSLYNIALYVQYSKSTCRLFSLKAHKSRIEALI